MYEFRLANGEFYSDAFLADSNSLKYRLHTAFAAFTAGNGVHRAVLEVRHKIHGWRQVCSKDNTLGVGQFQIIDNPLVLDFQRLFNAAIQTLAECDSWPTAQEKARLKAQRIAKVRDAMAKARRSSFRIV